MCAEGDLEGAQKTGLRCCDAELPLALGGQDLYRIELAIDLAHGILRTSVLCPAWKNPSRLLCH